MAEVEKSVIGSVRLDSDIWDAVRKMPLSLNQFLRKVLSADGVFEVPAKKVSKRQKAIETLKASDPMADQRPDVEYGSEELPSGGSVLDATGVSIKAQVGKASLPTWRAGRKPLLKPKERK
jgi:hypothetical protein